MKMVITIVQKPSSWASNSKLSRQLTAEAQERKDLPGQENLLLVGVMRPGAFALKTRLPEIRP